jgi:PEP-CTERM motif
MKRSLFRAALTCLTALTLAVAARADTFPQFDYSVTFTAPGLPAVPTATISSGSSNILLTGDSLNNVSGPNPLGFALINFGASSTTAAPATDTFNTTYTALLTIKDLTSGTQKSLTFTGTLDGTMNNGSAVFSASNNPLPTGGSLTIGANVYDITFNSFVGPNIPGPSGSPIGNQGGLGALITVNPSDLGQGSGAGAGNAPEPSSILLCGMGGLGFLAAWRRKRLAKKQ